MFGPEKKDRLVSPPVSRQHCDISAGWCVCKQTWRRTGNDAASVKQITSQLRAWWSKQRCAWSQKQSTTRSVKQFVSNLTDSTGWASTERKQAMNAAHMWKPLGGDCQNSAAAIEWLESPMATVLLAPPPWARALWAPSCWAPCWLEWHSTTASNLLNGGLMKAQVNQHSIDLSAILVPNMRGALWHFGVHTNLNNRKQQGARIQESPGIFLSTQIKDSYKTFCLNF